jgi:hypothetical protein
MTPGAIDHVRPIGRGFSRAWDERCLDLDLSLGYGAKKSTQWNG